MTDKEVVDNLEKYIDLILNKKCYDFNVAVAIKHLIKRCKELEQIEEAHHKLNGKLREELQLKDKMIKELVLALVSNHCSIQDIVREEICDNRCVGNDNWTCEKCIKEYFTKKASEK